MNEILGWEISSLDASEHHVTWKDGTEAIVHGTWQAAVEAASGRAYSVGLKGVTEDMVVGVFELRELIRRANAIISRIEKHVTELK